MFITTLLIFIAVLAVLILIHELGHFLSARWMGVGVEEFGLGFPPRLVKLFVKKGTIYSLNWIPFGGFVKIKGEQGENAQDNDSFINKKVWQRLLIVSSGVIMNVILTIVLLSIGYSLGSPQILSDDISPKAKVKNQEVQIIGVLPDTPAAQSGLEVGDVILSLDGQAVTKSSIFSDQIKEKKNSTVSLLIMRQDQKIIKEVALGQGIGVDGQDVVLGANLIQTGLVAYPWYEAIWVGVKSTGYMAKEILFSFGSLIRNLVVHHKAAVEVAGPVGIAVLTGEFARMGFIYLLQFVALLSLNLAIINFFPFPALDGGRFIFLLIEKVRGRPANQKIEAMIHNIGFIFLILLVLVVTYRDFLKWGGQILSALKGIIS